MPLTIPDLDTLDVDDVAARQAELYQRLAEKFTTVQLQAGVIRDSVLMLTAISFAALKSGTDAIERSSSLSLINADPSSADADIVDRLLSNFLITRRPGGPATGQVTIVLDSQFPVTVPTGAAFAASGVTFSTSAAYAARLSAASVVGENDRVLVPRGNGQYSFTIPVEAGVTGVAGMLKRGAALQPVAAIPHFVQAYAEGDFTGGLEAETNAELVARLQQGIAARTFGGRVNVDALIHDDDNFPDALQTSIIGAGDVEMLRDRHTIFPVSTFGHVDAYVRTAALPVTYQLTKTATLVAVTSDGGVWQFSLGRDEVPGFYEVRRVALLSAPQSDAGFAIQGDARSFDVGELYWAPDVVTPAEAAYSRYQTSTVRFLDAVTPTAGLAINSATADYSVAVAAMPDVAGIQSLLGSRKNRPWGADVLVRAPVPCFLSVSFTVAVPSGSAAIDAVAVASAVANVVNKSGFSGQVHASTIVGAVAGLIPAGSTLSAVDIFGRIRRPDGSTAYLRDPRSVAVTVPADPARGVTPRTVAFILDPADVAVSVAPLIAGDA